MLRLIDLQHFLVLSEELNFRLAAERLYTSQPTLSQTLQRLEQQLGTTLIERTTRSSHLTAAGETLFAGAKFLLKDAENLKADVRSVGLGLRRQIRVGAVNTAMQSLLPQVLRSVHTAFPDIRLGLQPMSSFTLMRQLREGRLDIAIVRTANELPGYKSVPLMQDPLLAVLPTAHQLADATHLQISELDGETFIMAPRSRNPEFYDELNSLYRRNGCTPEHILEVNGLHSQMALVGAGVGVTVQSTLYRDPGREDLVFIPVDDTLGIPLKVLHQDNEMSEPVEHFVQAALKRASQLIAEFHNPK